VKCAVCQNTSQQYLLTSTSSFRPPDLDLRPAPLERETLPFTIQQCPTCGYCASRIDKKVEGAEATVTSDVYRAQIEDKAFPELARSYLCASLLLADSNAGSAGWAALQAAWVCDDEADLGPARTCRLRASELFRSARSSSIPFAQEPAVESLVLADVLRRSGRFEDALAECETGIALEASGALASALQLERFLVEDRNTEVHRVDEKPRSNGS
jgi:hypothetical protein